MHFTVLPLHPFLDSFSQPIVCTFSCTAKKISEISYNDYLNQDIKVMDSTAISLAKDRSIPIIIFSILNSSNILDIVEGNGDYSIIGSK